MALGMLADRRDELGRAHTATLCRIHPLLLELIPGGAKAFLTARQARALIAEVTPRDAASRVRRRLVVEMIEELETIDRKTRAADKELRQLVLDRGSTLMDLHGIGPSSAARLLADTGDIHRFRDRDRFASWNGTAPLDASSGEQQRHRLSHAGNRKINRVLHIMAIVQLRNPTPGRVYYDLRKGGGKTSMEALRALKRRLSNLINQSDVQPHAQGDAWCPSRRPHQGAPIDSCQRGQHRQRDGLDQPAPAPGGDDLQPTLSIRAAPHLRVEVGRRAARLAGRQPTKYW
ncbi:transposase [Nocardia yamanashiensis]|uniref:transposase n=1 Tax=Nocardia yamanashiensis TaxID=209247 RepID=UPI001F3680A5|nr:transposase [Nocardia yamanashiensis]